MPGKQKKVITAKNIGKIEIDAPVGGKSKKKVASAPEIAKKGHAKAGHKVDPLIKARPRNFGIGQDIQPRRDMYRFVKWPQYVLRQRKKAILKKRLKVPPPINQFSQTLDRPTTLQVFQLCDKYRPISRYARKALLKLRAQQKTEGKADKPPARRVTVKNGIREVTQAVMQKKAKLVLIAHDVEPVEIVLFLPALCRKMGVPYAIVKGKARLGKIVRRKTTTCIAFTKFRDEDKAKVTKLVETVNNNYNLRFEEIRRHWGGGIMSQKSMAKVAKLDKARSKEVGVTQ